MTTWSSACYKLFNGLIIHILHLTWLFSHNYLYNFFKRNEPYIWFAFLLRQGEPGTSHYIYKLYWWMLEISTSPKAVQVKLPSYLYIFTLYLYWTTCILVPYLSAFIVAVWIPTSNRNITITSVLRIGIWWHLYPDHGMKGLIKIRRLGSIQFLPILIFVCIWNGFMGCVS